MHSLTISTPQGMFSFTKEFSNPALVKPAFEGAYYTVLQALESPDVSTLAQAMLQVYAFTEACVEQAHTLVLSLYAALPCAAGCSYCCRHLKVGVTPLEILCICRLLASEDSPFATQEIEAALVRFVETRSTEAPTAVNVDRHTGCGLACPFLVNDCCAIYPVRPLMCRGYNSTDAGRCKAFYEEPLNASHHPSVFQPQYEMVNGAHHGLRSVLCMHGLGTEAPIDLAEGVLLALRNPDIFTRWLAQERPFDVCIHQIDM